MRPRLISLRRYGPDDIALRYEWEATDIVRVNIHAKTYEMPRSVFIEQQLDRLRTEVNERRVFVIQSRRGRPLGLIWLAAVDWEERSAQLGVLIGPEAQRGIGFGPAAIEEIIRIAFEEYNLHTVCNFVYETNEGMNRLVENVEPDMVAEAAVNIDGRYVRSAVYTVIKGKRGLRW